MTLIPLPDKSAHHVAGSLYAVIIVTIHLCIHLCLPYTDLYENGHSKGVDNWQWKWIQKSAGYVNDSDVRNKTNFYFYYTIPPTGLFITTHVYVYHIA